MFITVEGPDGAGKTTQIRLLAEALDTRDYSVVTTREPGGTAIGDQIRSLLLDSDGEMAPETEAYLMTAARAEHVRQVIRPALAQGSVVICDRFTDSTLAYQGAGRGLDVDALTELQQLAVGSTVPDLVVLLDIDVEAGLARKRDNQVLNRLDRAHLDFHQRVAQWYRREARSHPNRWSILDATKPAEMVHTEVLQRVLDAMARQEPVGTER